MNMNTIKKTAVLLAMAALALCGCSSNSQQEGKDAGDRTAKVGIIQHSDHPSLNDAREGFLQELADEGYKEGENLQVDYKNAQGDQANLQSIATQLKGNEDLILSIATPAAQTMKKADPNTPQLYTAVTDPVTAKLVDSMDNPGGNMTGTSDMAPTEKVIDLLLKAKPDIQTVGVLYNSSEVNSQVQYEAAKAYIESKGLKCEAVTISSTNDVQAGIQALTEKCDGVYLPTDNTVASSIATIGAVLKDKKIPSVAGFSAGVEGALCAYGVDYQALGRQTGKMAVQILDGKKPEDLPSQYSEDLVVNVNEDMAQALGIDPAVLTAE